MDLAARSEMVEQVRAFVDWVGTGRKLTQTGRITLADARVLVGESEFGDPVYQVKITLLGVESPPV